MDDHDRPPPRDEASRPQQQKQPQAPAAPFTIGVDTSPTIAQLFCAMAKAQAEIQVAIKDREAKIQGSQGKSGYAYTYATLAAVWEACRGPLTKNGLAVIQLPRAVGAQVTVTTLVTHESGEWIRNELPLMASGPGPQQVGIAITYLRRYALSSMVGVTTDDDDDAAAEQARFERRHEPSGGGGGYGGAPPEDFVNPRGEEIYNEWLEAIAQASNMRELGLVAVDCRKLPKDVQMRLQGPYAQRRKILEAEEGGPKS